MEPRPPRPRTPGPLDRTAQAGARPGGAAAGGRAYPGAGQDVALYPPPGAPPGYGPGPAPYAGEPPLVPRQERRRQRVARVAGAMVIVLIVAGLLGWGVRDRLFADDGNQETPPATAASPPALAANDTTEETAPAASPPTPTQPSLVANVLATATPSPPATLRTPAAADPTEPAAPSTDAVTDAAADEPAAAPGLTDLLPTEAEVAGVLAGLTLLVDDERPRAMVVDSMAGTDPAARTEAEQLLDDWGWTRNVYRDFAAPDPAALSPDATTFINISVHGFGSPAAASDALTYFLNVVVAAQGLEEVTVDPVGDEVRLLRGVGADGTNVVAYIRQGPALIRLGAFSPGGDPTGAVLALAQMIVAG